MALTYSLMIDTELEPVQVAQFLANGLRLSPSRETTLRGEAVFAAVGKESKLGQEVVEEEFGFRPTLHVVFELYSSEDEDEGQRIIGRAAAALLRHEAGDAVLAFNGDDMMLLRRGGHVVVSDWHDWLTPQLDAASIRYERQHAMSPAA